jgi:hypothetical protein
MPRNVLLQGETDGGRLLLCDLPMLMRYCGPLPARARLIDLFDAAFSPSRRRELSATERWRFLCAYAGDRKAAALLWRALARRSRLGHRLRLRLLVLFRLYLLGSLRPLARTGPTDPDRR